MRSQENDANMERSQSAIRVLKKEATIIPRNHSIPLHISPIPLILHQRNATTNRHFRTKPSQTYLAPRRRVSTLNNQQQAPTRYIYPAKKLEPRDPPPTEPGSLDLSSIPRSVVERQMQLQYAGRLILALGLGLLIHLLMGR